MPDASPPAPGPATDSAPATESRESGEQHSGSQDSVDSAARKGGLGRLRAYAQLMRPGNALMAAVGGATGLAIAGGPLRDVELVLAATLPPLLIAAYGNVVNDLRDLELDRQAHPARPLPS